MFYFTNRKLYLFIFSFLTFSSFSNVDTSKFYQLIPRERELINNYFATIDTCTTDSSRIVAIRKMYMQMNDNDVWILFADETKKYLDKYLKENGKTEFYKEHILNYYNDKAYYEAYKDNDKAAIKYYIKAYYLAKELNRYDKVYTYLNNIGQYLHKIGQFEKAVTLINEAFKILENSGQFSEKALLLNNLAYMYYEQGENPQALEYYKQALDLGHKQKDSSLLGLIHNNLSLIYFDESDFIKAEEHIQKSVFYRKLIGEEIKYAQSLNNLASLYIKQNRLDEAIPIIYDVINIKKKNQDFESLNYTYFTLSNVFLQKDKWDSAYYYAQKAMQVADFYKYPYMYKDASGILYQIFDKNKQLDSAYIYYRLHVTMRDSIYNEKNINATIKQKLKNDFEKREAILKAQKESELAIANSEKQKQKILNYFIFFVLLAVSIITFITYRSLKLSQRQKHIIQLQKENSEQQRKIVEEKNKEILDSIHYAKRIQQALITSELYIDKHLKRLMKRN
ncbi:MAG: tetratricopeptide repeat protein [Bacteroidia bacterium]